MACQSCGRKKRNALVSQGICPRCRQTLQKIVKQEGQSSLAVYKCVHCGYEIVR